jgi:hypothetical protein
VARGSRNEEMQPYGALPFPEWASSCAPGSGRFGLCLALASPRPLLMRHGHMRVGPRVLVGVGGNHFEEGVYPGRLAIAGILWYMAQYVIINPLSCLSAVLLRHSVLRKVGWFDTSMRMCGDVDFMLRMMEQGDLAVLRAEGAVIKVHPGAVGYQLMYSDAALVETIAITQRYAELLEEAGLFEEVQRRMAAGLTGYALVLLKKRQFGLSKKFFRAAAQPFTEWPHLAVGVARFFVLHFLRVVLGVHMLPPAVRRGEVHFVRSR